MESKYTILDGGLNQYLKEGKIKFSDMVVYARFSNLNESSKKNKRYQTEDGVPYIYFTHSHAQREWGLNRTQFSTIKKRLRDAGLIHYEDRTTKIGESIPIFVYAPKSSEDLKQEIAAEKIETNVGDVTKSGHGVVTEIGHDNLGDVTKIGQGDVQKLDKDMSPKHDSSIKISIKDSNKIYQDKKEEKEEDLSAQNLFSTNVCTVGDNVSSDSPNEENYMVYQITPSCIPVGLHFHDVKNNKVVNVMQHLKQRGYDWDIQTAYHEYSKKYEIKTEYVNSFGAC